MKLILEDGTEFRGISNGIAKAVTGEVVFNTGMSGYVEALTDPSYRGQILVLTYPLVGNYGVPTPRPVGSLDRPFESSQIQVQGLVIQHMVDSHSHHSAVRSLNEWLDDEQIPYVSGVDTRALTRKLREKGTMQGWLLPNHLDWKDGRNECDAIGMSKELFEIVTPPEPVIYSGGDLKILLVDVGAKDNIVRSLLSRSASVLRVPWSDDLKMHASGADGIVIGNGPGDPSHLADLVVHLKGILEWFNKPIFGICMGHQLLALAAGASTYKLPYGHRSLNQPVQDQLTKRCYVTSQNHGYAVDDKSLPTGWVSWFANINDGTNEGIRSDSKPYFGVQFHPESHPGPRDTEFLFDDYMQLVRAAARP